MVRLGNRLAGTQTAQRCSHSAARMPSTMIFKSSLSEASEHQGNFHLSTNQQLPKLNQRQSLDKKMKKEQKATKCAQWHGQEHNCFKLPKIPKYKEEQ